MWFSMAANCALTASERSFENEGGSEEEGTEGANYEMKIS